MRLRRSTRSSSCTSTLNGRISVVLSIVAMSASVSDRRMHRPRSSRSHVRRTWRRPKATLSKPQVPVKRSNKIATNGSVYRLGRGQILLKLTSRGGDRWAREAEASRRLSRAWLLRRSRAGNSARRHRGRRAGAYRRGRLRGLGRVLFRRERALPPSDLEADGPGMARASRPRRRVPADRGHVHAVRVARDVRGLGGARDDDRLDGSSRRNAVEALLVSGAEMALGCDRRRARLGECGCVLATPQGADTRARTGRGGRIPLHAGRGSLRLPAARSLPAGVRVPRALPRADPRSGGLPVRGNRLLRPAEGVAPRRETAPKIPSPYEPEGPQGLGKKTVACRHLRVKAQAPIGNDVAVPGRTRRVTLEQARRIAVRAQLLDGSARGVL